MRPMTKLRFFVAGVLVAGFGLGWAVAGGQDVAEAQAPHAPFMMQRIYTGIDGLSHVENIELNEQSVLEQVTGMRVRVSPPGRFVDYHVAPGRRYIINLTGGGQLEVAEGKVDLPAGSIEYIDDLTGKGHTTANIGNALRVSIHLEFANQNQIIGQHAVVPGHESFNHSSLAWVHVGLGGRCPDTLPVVVNGRTDGARRRGPSVCLHPDRTVHHQCARLSTDGSQGPIGASPNARRTRRGGVDARDQSDVPEAARGLLARRV